MNSLRLLGLFSLALSALVLAGCGTSTSVDGTWTAPNADKLNFRKVLVVAATPDGSLRRSAEDAMKAEVRSAEAVTSYSLIGDTQQLKDADALLAVLRNGGFDGVIVVRLVAERTEITASPEGIYPEPYRMFRGYYSPRFALSPFYYDSGRITTDRIVQLETNIYEVAGERLVWSGVTSTRNPSSVQQLIQEAAAAMRAVLAKAGR